MQFSSLRHLRIADLELFISCAYLNSLSKAAEAHHLSQSAASAAILRVETAFGKPLCTHQKRAFALTQEGKKFLLKVEKWLRDLNEIVLRQDVSPIRLATTHAIARVVVPALLPHEKIDVQLMRPDMAYGAVLRDEADVAVVLDNASWEGVTAAEVGKGFFQLYSKRPKCRVQPVLLPEDQIEVLALQQRWHEQHNRPLAIKTRLPSWSLIADICSRAPEVGFLPDFLAQDTKLAPVSWQPSPSQYRVLALYRGGNDRIKSLLAYLKEAF